MRARAAGSRPGPVPYQRRGEDDDRPALFPDDPDLLRQRSAASRPRLYDGRVRRAGAVYAARWVSGQIPDRQRRAWPEGRAIGARRRHCAAGILRPHLARLARDDAASQHQQRRFHPHDRAAPCARRRGAVAGAGTARRDLSRALRRLVCGARRGVLCRERTHRRARRQKGRADRRGCRMAGGGKLFLSAVGLAGSAVAILRGAPRCGRAALAPQRGHQLCQIGAQRFVDLAHQLQLGRAGAGTSWSRGLCLGRRADQLHQRARLSGYRGRVRDVLAGRSAHGRQGYRAVSFGLLAGLSDGGRARAAAPRVCAWLVDRRGPEDVKIPRQLHPAKGARRQIRARPGALFPVARIAVRQ